MDMVRIASSALTDPRAAALAVLAELEPVGLCGIAVFCSSRYDLAEVAAAFAELPPTVTVIGCTTAGEITPLGRRSGSVTAIGFPASDFSLRALRFEDLNGFDAVAAHQTIASMVTDAARDAAHLCAEPQRVGLLLLDGLSCREELITHAIQHVLQDIPLIGGSAADDNLFKETCLLFDGEFRSDCAVLAILSSRRRLRMLHTEHHRPTDEYAVVTRCDPANRTVHELNGLPAADEYAKLVGLDPDQLNGAVFAESPFMVRAGGRYFARAIMQAEPDGSLRFHSAIDRGLVLRVGRPDGRQGALSEAIDEAGTAVGPADCVIVFESAQNSAESDCEDWSRPGAAPAHRLVGFQTYGEQFRDIHVNRTVAALMIGREPAC